MRRTAAGRFNEAPQGGANGRAAHATAARDDPPRARAVSSRVALRAAVAVPSVLQAVGCAAERRAQTWQRQTHTRVSDSHRDRETETQRDRDAERGREAEVQRGREAE